MSSFVCSLQWKVEAKSLEYNIEGEGRGGHEPHFVKA